MKKMRWLCIFMSMLFILSGCGNNKQEKREHTIPADGMIKAQVFQALQADRELAIFKGEEGQTRYQWTFVGTDITNPQDTNLFMTFSTGEERKEELGAERILAFSFPDKKTRDGNPSISITPGGDWQIEAAEIYTGNSEAAKVCDAQWIDGTATFSLSNYEGLFYLVGKNITPETEQQTQESNAQSIEAPENTPDPDLERSASTQPTQKMTETPPKQDTSPQPVQTQDGNQAAEPAVEVNTQQKKPTVTISIRCDRAVANWEKLDSSVQDERIVPKSGAILPETTVVLEDGDTAFSVLKRMCRENKIHMESTSTPVYGSAYVEGINNLYEFDCGALSGWMYAVNGAYANYGSSKCVLKDGDIVRWDYTCDLGRDLGKEIVR